MHTVFYITSHSPVGSYWFLDLIALYSIDLVMHMNVRDPLGSLVPVAEKGNLDSTVPGIRHLILRSSQNHNDFLERELSQAKRNKGI